MKNYVAIFSLCVFTTTFFSCNRDAPNTLSDQEIKDGWVLLFDGTTTDSWQSCKTNHFPDSGWKVENGELIVLGNGGDIITKELYSNFDLKVDFKLTPQANSGVKYFVADYSDTAGKSHFPLGLEFQILDDVLHPDARLGSHEGSRTIASLYDLIKAENKKPAPVGEWNHGEIISNGSHVEHWLNGTKVVEYERGSAEFKKLVSESKYKDYVNFGEAPEGYILLQDHGDTVHYRNIKIKKLEVKK